MDPLLKPEDVMRILQVSYRTFHRLVRGRTLPAFKVGGQWRMRPGDLDSYLTRRRRVGRRNGRSAGGNDANDNG